MADDTRDYGNCILEVKENYAVLTFNRPDKFNAFDPPMFNDLLKAYRDAIGDTRIRALVFTGAGEHFSAGGDVEKEIDPLKHKNPKEFKAYFEELAEMYVAVYNLQIPTIAAVNGFALGAGMELALICDIRIAAESAQMGEFFVKMGLVPEVGMCLLPKIVGMGMAKLLCYTGDFVNAQEALRIGLVEKVVPTAELLPQAEKLASRLARGPYAVSVMKKAINEMAWMPLGETVNMTIGYQYEAVKSADHAEAVKSFLEKRKPKFIGE